MAVTGGRLTVDWRAVGAGAMVALAVAVPVILAGQALPRGSGLVVPLYLVLLAGLVAGGRRAGRRRPDAPLTHGALAALATTGTLLAAIVIVRKVAGESTPNVVAVVFNLLMSASAGILGGLLSTRKAPAAPAAEPPT